MNIYLLLEVLFVGGILLALDRKAVQSVGAYASILGYVLLFPLTAFMVPEINAGPLRLDAGRMFLALFWGVFLVLALKNPLKIRISRIAAAMLLYNLYLIVSSSLNGVFYRNEVVNFFLPLGFVLMLDNIDFSLRHLVLFEKIASVLVVIVALVSFMQLTVDPYLFSSSVPDQGTRLYQIDRSLFRNRSVFAALGMNEGGIAMGFLALAMMFKNFFRIRLKYLLLSGLILFSVLVTFSRYVWLMPVIGLLFFLYYKYRGERRVLVLLVVLFVSISAFWIYTSGWQRGDSALETVAARSVDGRIQSIDIYFDHFWGRRMVFGFGDWTQQSGAFYRYGRHTVHNGILDVLFRGGFVGLGLFFWVMWQVFRKGREVYRRTGNPIFMAFVVIYLFINTTADLNFFHYFGFLFMLVYLTIYYRVVRDRRQAEELE
jgi:hypothetical protein